MSIKVLVRDADSGEMLPSGLIFPNRALADAEVAKILRCADEGSHVVEEAPGVLVVHVA